MKCPVCGKAELKDVVEDFYMEYLKDGRIKELTVQDLHFQRCPECLEDILDHAATLRIEASQI